MKAAANPYVLDQDQLGALMGYERAGDVERKLIAQGIRPIYGKPGHFFVTLDQLTAAGGTMKGPAESQEIEI